MVELGQPGDLQGFEEPALRCRAPPEGRRKPRGAPGGVGSPRGPPEGPQVSDPGGVARQGADLAGLPGRGSGTPHHGREPSRPPLDGQCRATTAGGTRGPSEGLHEGPTLGRGGREKSATPQPTAGSRGRDRQAAPPRSSGAGARGPEGPPHPPPPPPQARERTEAHRKDGGPAPPPEEAAASRVRGHRGRGKRPP